MRFKRGARVKTPAGPEWKGPDGKVRAREEVTEEYQPDDEPCEVPLEMARAREEAG